MKDAANKTDDSNANALPLDLAVYLIRFFL